MKLKFRDLWGNLDTTHSPPGFSVHGMLQARKLKWIATPFSKAFPDSSVGKESACNVGDPSSIPGSGRSTGEGIGYPLQHSWASLVAGKDSPCNVGDLGLVPELGRSPGEGKSYLLQ